MESYNTNIHAASDCAQDKKVRVRVLGRGTRLKISYSLPHKLTVTGNPPKQSLSVWGGKWGQRTENVLELDQIAGF